MFILQNIHSYKNLNLIKHKIPSCVVLWISWHCISSKDSYFFLCRFGFFFVIYIQNLSHIFTSGLSIFTWLLIHFSGYSSIKHRFSAFLSLLDCSMQFILAINQQESIYSWSFEASHWYYKSSCKFDLSSNI